MKTRRVAQHGARATTRRRQHRRLPAQADVSAGPLPVADEWQQPFDVAGFLYTKDSRLLFVRTAAYVGVVLAHGRVQIAASRAGDVFVP